MKPALTYCLYGLLLVILSSTVTNTVLASEKIAVIRIETAGLTPLQVGLEVGRQTKSQFPTLEHHYDAWLAELFSPSQLARIRQHQLPALLAQMQTSRLEEMRGIAAAWQLTTESDPGDGRLSLTEYQILNLLPDLGLAPDGVGVASFGQVTTDTSPIIGHNLEWRNNAAIRSLQLITVYHNAQTDTGSADSSFVTVGLAGLVSVLQGFNQYGVFAALINARPYSPYATGAHASTTIELKEQQLSSFSVRELLEQATSAGTGAKRLNGKQYAFAHNILLADTNGVQVQEYSPQRGYFRTRHSDSRLHHNFSWKHPQQLAVIDCLMLADMPNTCRDAKDIVRWQRLNTLMHFSQQQRASANAIAGILFDGAGQHYELFSSQNTLRSLYFLPESNSLYLYTAPRLTNSEQQPAPAHHAYLNLLPRTPPWKATQEWLLWALFVLMLGILSWFIWQHRKTALANHSIQTGGT